MPCSISTKDSWLQRTGIVIRYNTVIQTTCALGRYWVHIHVGQNQDFLPFPHPLLHPYRLWYLRRLVYWAGEAAVPGTWPGYRYAHRDREPVV